MHFLKAVGLEHSFPFLGLIQCLNMPGFPSGVQTTSHSPKYAAFLPNLMPLHLVFSRLGMPLSLPPAPVVLFSHTLQETWMICELGCLSLPWYTGNCFDPVTLHFEGFIPLFACFKDFVVVVIVAVVVVWYVCG